MNLKGVRALQSFGPRTEYMRRLVRLLPKPARVIEVGSWVGCSALVWAEELNDPESLVLCVDPFEPYFSDKDVALNTSAVYRDMEKALKSGEALQCFYENTKESKTPVRLLRAKFAEVSHALGSANLVYIDGSHYYPEVLNDIRGAEFLVKPGGYLCGDDLEAQMSELETFGFDLRSDMVKTKTKSFHPGVTKGVWEFFKQEVSCYEGFWVMQKKGVWCPVSL